MPIPPVILGRILIAGMVIVAGGLSTALALLRNKDNLPGPTVPESQKKSKTKKED